MIFFNDPATTEIYTLSLHDALPISLASSVFDRCDDSNGTVIAVFHEACHNIGDVAQRANTNPTALADQAFDALTRNDYGQLDRKSTRLNSSHSQISYAVFCLTKKKH